MSALDLAAIIKQQAQALNKVATAAYADAPYSAPKAAPAWRQPCRCERLSFPHKRDRYCEALLDQTIGDAAHEEYDPDDWQNRR